MAFSNHGFGGGEEEEAKREGKWVTEVFRSKNSPKERGLGEVEEVGLTAEDQVTIRPLHRNLKKSFFLLLQILI